ncbi:agmatine deiminase family protein [Geminicoccaceae bacterium 1502E]|nr:agmatine deiminase family protein [Geminicoccaceae bacterium 1502E]
MSTPRDDGFWMPAEWAPHSRCWMAWPCREELWGDRLEAARRVYADVAKAISRFEPVTMIARPELTASVSLLCGSGIAVLPMPQDDSWTRDTGPSFLLGPDGARAGADWRFNGWGDVYEDYAQDRQMARRVLEHLGLPRYEAPMVMEGGALHVDGEGTCLVCDSSVLDAKRNPGMSREEAESVLCAHLGVQTVIWLPDGLVDDETSGHIDNLACFARPGTVLALSTDDQADENYVALQRNLEVLRAARDAKGRELEILPLPLPRPRLRDDGRRLTLSYANFYLANGGVVMPAFDDPADKVAYKAVAAAFPDREVVQIEASDLLHGGGGIHCITQQEPSPAA